MGLFGSICRGIGRCVGRCVEKVGSFIGSERIEDAGRNIQDACTRTSKDVGRTYKYVKETASVRQTVNINEILAGFSIGLQEQADSLEKECIIKVQEYFKEIVKVLENSNTKMNTSRLKLSLRDMKKSINGSIKNHLAKRVSIDDRECLKILEMDSGKNKENSMRRFGKKVINEALNNLSVELSEIAMIQNDEIKEYLEDILEKQTNEFKIMKNQYDEILVLSDKEVTDKEISKLKPEFLIEMSDLILFNFNM